MNRLAGFLAMAAGLGLAAASSGAVAATECNTGPPPAAALSGTITGGVVVNAGDFCVLGGATVYGGVRVNEGGILIACGSTINGGVVTNGALGVLIGPEEIACAGDLIHGGVWISNTGPGVFPPPAPSLAVENSKIDGGVHLIGNQGPIAVASNLINGGLFCKNNAVPDVDDEGMPSVVTGETTCEFGE